MSLPQVVIDTNVIVAGFRSRRGSAFQLLTLIGTEQFDIHLSVPLVLEYTEVLLRELPNLYLNRHEIDDLIDFYCSVGVPHEIFSFGDHFYATQKMKWY
jgi:predicted nucleic acid-binding protein